MSKTFVAMLVGVVLLSGVALQSGVAPSAQAPEGGAGDAAARIAELEEAVEALGRQIADLREPAPAPPPAAVDVLAYYREAAVREMAVLTDGLAASRRRIANLPRRSCALTVRWTKLTTRFDAILARLREASARAAAAPGQPMDLLVRDLNYEAAERRHALTGLENLDELITRAEGLGDRVCAKEAEFAALEREEEGHQRRVRGQLLEVAKDTRGNEFPLRANEFRTFYQNRGSWPRPSSGSSWRAGSISIAEPHRGRRAGQGRRALSIEEAFSVVRSITSVNDGRVTVRSGSGRQQATTQWYDGGGVWRKNRIRYWLAQDFPKFSLYRGRHTRWCAGKPRASHCWGWSGYSSLKNRLAADPQYDLGRSFFPALEAALQKEVTAACERRVADGPALDRLLAARRPARGRARTIYVAAADAFQAKVLRLAQGSADDLCGERSRLLSDVVATSMELIEPRGELEVIRKANATYRREKQDELDAHVENLLEEQTVAVEATEDSAGQAQAPGPAAGLPGGPAAANSAHPSRVVSTHLSRVVRAIRGPGTEACLRTVTHRAALMALVAAHRPRPASGAADIYDAAAADFLARVSRVVHGGFLVRGTRDDLCGARKPRFLADLAESAIDSVRGDREIARGHGQERTSSGRMPPRS